jgi:hypothetical protein
MSHSSKSSSNDNAFASCGEAADAVARKRSSKALRNTIEEILAEEPILNKMEQMSIQALIAYTAYDKGVSKEVVLALIEDRFGVDEIVKIQRSDFDKVIRYLVDLDPKKLVN